MRGNSCYNTFRYGRNPCLSRAERYVAASGYPGKAMGVILTAIAINCVLNPLFIFGFKWGIAGSAFATVIAQTVAMSIELVHFMRNKHFIHFERKMFGLKAHIVKGIFSIGVSPFLMNICASIVVIFINKSLMTYGGDFYVGAYGIINRVLMVFIMIVIGLNQGMQPIVGYNFGARKFDRVARALRYAIFAAVAVTTSGFLMAEIFPHLLANMFTGDQELIDIASHGMRIVLIMFPIVGFQMVTANFFQSIGKVRKAILLSLTRQMLFLVPASDYPAAFYGYSRGVDKHAYRRQSGYGACRVPAHPPDEKIQGK